ncbi:Ubiquitin-protein ligase RMD5 [Paramicrosporidium saccamoebae]|uniref:GID complex catalytic subunit 2 n=1 Tax=Paramicrosporidium saccamoebae TaxID=1246581 RepID=A0A2H9TMD2_9FUNG|nr:Ubiquitin-protein ligase RMD5 [Paramicrosporidium saccamoebae]
MNQCLLQHFYREGNFEAGDSLSQEMHSMTDSKLKEPFEGMHNLTRALSDHQIAPVVEWAHRNEKVLELSGLRLQFQLHTLQFITLLRETGAMAALKYAKHWLAPFNETFPADVESLMGALAFGNSLEESPYRGILYDDMWGEAEDALIAAYCTVLGLPRESSLRLCLNIGTSVWPRISKVLGIMKDRPGVDWNPEEELPVEVDTGPAGRFHSVFVCPVLRQQSNAINPPMMMPCGHVICLEALNRLSKGNQNYRIKCPYCPAESTASMAQRITF